MLAQALDAARQLSMPSDAYGVPRRPSTVPLRPIEKRVLDTLSRASEALDAMADSLKATAETQAAVACMGSQPTTIRRRAFYTPRSKLCTGLPLTT